jgi:hypothetical protein
VQVLAVSPEDALFDAFLDLPWRIYPGRHLWLPSSKKATRVELSCGNPFFSHGQAQAFVCVEGDQTLGRIVASLDERRADEMGVGHFGYFEAVENDRVVSALLQSAERWLRSRGRQVVEGPVDLNIWTRYRVQVSGFDSKPYIGEPRSPPYYARLLEANGFRERMQWRSYDFSLTELESMGEHFAQRRKLRYENENLSVELQRVPWSTTTAALCDLHVAVMSSWSGNYGFSYIDAHELAQALAALVDILDPRMCFFFRDAQQVCAFGLGHLDAAEDAKPERAILKAYGIAPAYRKTHLIYEILRDLTRHAQAVARLPAVLSLAAEQSDLWSQFKSPTRIHAVYRKALTL